MEKIKDQIDRRARSRVMMAFGLKTDEEAIKRVQELQEDFRIFGPKGVLVQEYVRNSVLLKED